MNMASTQELQGRLDRAEAELRRRDREQAEAKSAALAAKNVTDNATDLAERMASAATAREAIRRGAHASVLIAQQDPAAPVDFGALEKLIPAEGWPAGLDESKFTITAPLPKEKTVAVASTLMGKMLASRGTL
jgi:multidrug efflux pump subunit AcrA (membrane-fusion protein)